MDDTKLETINRKYKQLTVTLEGLDLVNLSTTRHYGVTVGIEREIHHSSGPRILSDREFSVLGSLTPDQRQFLRGVVQGMLAANLEQLQQEFEAL